MISLKNITKSFDGQTVLQNVNLSITEYESIALVGKNGSGKSTLLKILADLLKPDKGQIEKSSNLKIAYFPQEIPQEYRKKTGKEFLAQKMDTISQKVLGNIGILCKQLNFPAEKIDIPIEDLSGGEKSKLMSMFVLRSQADIFLLDEPTNNLDLQGLIVLENFILTNQHGFLIVSHDRKFLDKVVSNIIEIDEDVHSVNIYHNVSYVSYVNEKKRREQKSQEMYDSYQTEKQRLSKSARNKKQEARKMSNGSAKKRDNDKYITGFKKDRARKIASHASVIEKRMNRLKKVEQPKRHLPLNLHFRFLQRSGDIVFQLEDIELTRNHFHLGPLNLEINFGDRIAILGPNGQGKSTLLQILIQECEKYSGCIRIGTKVKIGYLAQEINFKPDENILSYFLKITKMNQSEARRILARFGFLADNIKINLQDLSSGEKSRLVLATLMAREVNCLILDEPTNHLDPEALDRLEQALRKFSGTIIMVSHDRYLIDQIDITKTFLMENGKLTKLRDYHEYEERIITKT